MGRPRKLTDSEIEEIRKIGKTATHKQLALRFKVSVLTIFKAIHFIHPYSEVKE